MNKQLVGQRFLKAKESYDRHAVIQKNAAQNLASSFGEKAPVHLSCLLEIGAGTGFLTKALLRRFTIDKFYINDLSIDSVLSLTEELSLLCPSTEFIPLAGDADQIPFPEELDAIVSSSCVQWLEDPENFVRKSSLSLRRQGWMALSTYGKGNMKEISSLTSIGLSYLSQQQWKQILTTCFTLYTEHSSEETLFFETPLQVLHHLQQTGVTGISTYRWNKTSLSLFETRYNQLYRSDKGLPLSWNLIGFIAQKEI